MIKLDDCITLVSVAHPPTYNLDTGPPSTFGMVWCKEQSVMQNAMQF